MCFLTRKTLGALPPNPQQEHRPCTRFLPSREWQEERQKNTAVPLAAIMLLSKKSRDG